MREGRGVFGAGVYLRVMGIAVEVQVEMVENLSERADVNNEEEWAKHRALGHSCMTVDETEEGPTCSVTFTFRSLSQLLTSTE